MNNLDLLKMALDNLRKRKLRTFLTMLSVIIGTSAIVLIIAFGIGLKVNMIHQYEKMGSLDEIEVYPGYDDKGMKALTIKDLNKIKKIKNIAWVASIRRFDGLMLQMGNYVSYLSLTGVDDAYIGNFNYKLAEGSLLANGERSSMLVGQEVLTRMAEIQTSNSVNHFNTQPVAPAIDIAKDNFFLRKSSDPAASGESSTLQSEKSKFPIKIVGVGAENEYGLMGSAVVTMTDFFRIKSALKLDSSGTSTTLSAKNNIDQLRIRVTDKKYVLEVQETLKEKGYTSSSMIEVIKQAEIGIYILQGVLGSIAAISLFIAGIGITNTMMMSVFERKKEIGIMKVIGATITDIRKLFLIEASFIGLFGGVIGIVCCYVVAFGINQFSADIFKLLNNEAAASLSDTADKLLVIPLWLVLSAASFTAILGLISGYFPARRAMRLSALEAINS